MDTIEIGTVLKPQGLKGKLKLRIYSDDMGHIRLLSHLYLNNQRYDINEISVSGEFAFVLLDGINSIDDAEKFRNYTVSIDRSDAKKKASGEEYIADLIGLNVVDEKGKVYGKISDIEYFGASYIVNVKGSKNFSFPYIDRVVTKIDQREKIMYVDSKNLGEVMVI